MNRKIMGVTVGTPTSPNKIKDEIKPVQTVNGQAPDENGNVEVGASNAAPAGYGLGERVGRIAKDANDAVENGWWWGGGHDAVNYPEGVFGVAPMFVSASEFMVVQTIYWMNYVLRRSGNRAGEHIDWFAWAYENPPLSDGKEYLTTERVNGVFIYKKADAEGNIYYRLTGETEWRNYTNVAGGGGGGIMEESDPTVPTWAKQATKPKYTAEEVGARPADWTPTESDPTVPAWAKQPNKPTYKWDEIEDKPDEIGGGSENAVEYTAQTLTENQKTQARTNISAAPAYTYGTEDLEAGVSPLPKGTLYFVYE